jgi:hypothetical protein
MFIDGNSLQKIARTLTEEKVPKPSVHKKMNYPYSEKTKDLWDERTIFDILKNPKSYYHHFKWWFGISPIRAEITCTPRGVANLT